MGEALVTGTAYQKGKLYFLTISSMLIAYTSRNQRLKVRSLPVIIAVFC